MVLHVNRVINFITAPPKRYGCEENTVTEMSIVIKLQMISYLKSSAERYVLRLRYGRNYNFTNQRTINADIRCFERSSKISLPHLWLDNGRYKPTGRSEEIGEGH